MALVLVALLVDWQKIAKKKAKKNGPSIKDISSKLKLPSFNKSSTKAAEDQKGFDFDPQGEKPEPLLEIIIPEEEDGGYIPDREVEGMLAEADIHFRKGEIKAAEKFYLQAAAKDPRCSKAYSRLGVIYLENGENYDDAEAAFRQAIKFEPGNGYIFNNLGLVLYHQDKFADAVRHFEQAVRQDELNAARHANLGMAYMAMRQYAKSESSFKKALKLAPNEMEYKDLLNEAIEKKKAHKTMIRR